MDAEQEIQRLLAEQDLRGAATLAVDAYGAELFGFLVHYLRNETDASDIFSQTWEDMWRGLSSYRAQCSMRTWLYTLARHAASRLAREPHRRPGRRAGLSELDAAIERARTATPIYVRTPVKDSFDAIRSSLAEEDRALLVLRVDRGFIWNDIARVFLGVETSEEVLARESARLRKRFHVLKEEIRKRAHEAGILHVDEVKRNS